MFTSLAADLRHVSRPAGNSQRIVVIALLLLAVFVGATTALAQAAGQQPQPAPPIAGSPQHQMTQGTGPSPQAESHAAGGEAALKLPMCTPGQTQCDLSTVNFIGERISGHTLLEYGLIICGLGLLFGLVIMIQLKNLPVHRAMREISELIYETCKTYLITQGKFLLLLWAFIAVVIVLYFGVLLKYEAMRVVIILLFSVVGIAGSYGVAWFGIRVNTFANSRTAFASLGGKP